MDYQGTAVKALCERDGLLYLIGNAGVNIYRKSDWQSIAWAVVAGVVGGAVNDNGLYLATATGVWKLPHGVLGASTSQLELAYSATTARALQSANVLGVAAAGNALLVVTDAGADYLPTPVTITHYPVVSLPGACAIWGSKIAYAVAASLHVLTAPSADWDETDAAVLTTASSPAILSDTVQALAAGADLFIGTPSGVSIYDNTDVVNLTATELGTVVDVKALWPTAVAAQAAGWLAYGTSNGSDGGRFGVLNLSGTPADETTTSGDVTGAVWLADALTDAIVDDTLERYRLVAEISPGANALNVRRDWNLYAEITDALGGIETGTVALTVNGVSQTPAASAITDGFAVTYTPASNSGYGERVTIVLSGTDAGGNTVSRTWVFTTAGAPALTASDASPPNVTCIRDISLALAESDETVDSINVVWLDTHTSPLIVTEAQAREVGRVKIDETTFHRHRVGVRVLATDTGTLQTRDLRPGSIATITCAALGMTAQKCEILAAQRTIDDSDEDISFDLQAAYYEEV
jgi:hypothetical protein